jgi:hypothetical protein
MSKLRASGDTWPGCAVIHHQRLVGLWVSCLPISLIKKKAAKTGAVAMRDARAELSNRHLERAGVVSAIG